MSWRTIVSGSPIRSISLVALTVMLASGCSGPDMAAANAQIAKLLPSSTVAVLRIASIDELDNRILSMVDAMGQDDPGVSCLDMLAMSPMPLGDVRLIDSTLPIVVAVTSKRATPPTVALLVPTTDGAAYQKSLAAASITATVEGNYFAVPIFGPYERAATASNVLTQLKPGVLSVHANVESLTRTYRVMINSAIEMFERQVVDQMEAADENFDGEAMAELYGTLGRTVSEAAKTLDLSIDFKDGMLDFDVSLDVLPDSSMAGWGSAATDLTPLARGMTGKGSVEVLFQMDISKVKGRYDQFLDAVMTVYPEEFRATMEELMASYEGIYDQIESGMMIEGDMFNGDGMQFVAHMMPKDPAKFVTMITDTLKKDSLKTMGFVAQAPQMSTDGDTLIYDINIDIDAEKLLAVTGQKFTSESPAILQSMFGDGLSIRIAHRGDRVVMAFGNGREQAAKAAINADEGSWSPFVQSALARLEGCSPILIERLDLVGAMSGAFASMKIVGRAMPEVPKGSSANMVFFGGIKGSQWRGGMSIDMVGMGGWIRAMSPR